MLRRAVLVTSVLLCVAVLYLWSRTFRRFDSVERLTDEDVWYSLLSSHSGIELTVLSHASSHPRSYNPISSDPPRRGWSFRSQAYAEVEQEPLPAVTRHLGAPDGGLTTGRGSMVITAAPSRLSFPGIQFNSDSWFWTWSRPGNVIIFQRRTSVSVSLWLLLAVFALPGVIETILLLRGRARRAAGLCLICGYDVRASPDRCPECGTRLPTKVA